MNPIRAIVSTASAACLLAVAAGAWAAEQKLAGDQEVPPVATGATGAGTITIAADGTVSGSVTTKDIDGTMAHIHAGAPGANGPVIVPLAKTADGVWSVPAGAKLTPEQLKAFQDGGLYVNVHSAAHKGGEIRAQLKP